MKFFDSLINRKNRIVTAGIMAAAEAQTAREEAASKPQSKTARRLKKIAAVAATMAIAATMLCVTAFADTTGGSGITQDQVITFVGKAETAFTTVIVLIGAALAFVGIVNYLEGHGSDNDAAKSKGMKMLMGGIGIAALGFIAVPALFDLIENAM